MSYAMRTVSTQEPISWQVNNQEHVPVNRFGKDHWTTFGYIETRIVDYVGLLNLDHMRIDQGRHPMLATMRPRRLAGFDLSFTATGDNQYPTRLKSEAPNSETGRFTMVNLDNHDDYDCVDDLVAAGLLEIEMPTIKDGVFVNSNGGVCRDQDGKAIRADLVTGMMEQILMANAHFVLTPRGQAVASEYRAWRAQGNNSHQFMPSGIAMSIPVDAYEHDEIG